MEADFLLDENGILERVDEYSLYCHYLEFEPEIRHNYTSPLRDDDENPSFGIYPANQWSDRELVWKDSGGMGEKGDIFKLVQLMYGLPTRADAVAKVKSDFGLSSGKYDASRIIRHPMKIKDPADIRVIPGRWKRDDLLWWSQWHIDKPLLMRYRVSPLYCYWLYPKQKCPQFPGKRSYVYRVYDRYQLYFPERRIRRFQSDLQEGHILGLEQLQMKSDLLIITKSMKDIMCLASFGYEAIAPRSENTPMPEGAFDWISRHYKRVIVLFDNDGKHRAEWYPYPLRQIPLESGSKDPSDFTRDYGPAEAKALFNQLTV